MATYRFPILIWEDHQGAFTAATVDRDLEAVAATRAEALEQLREYLTWRFKEDGWLEPPDFVEPAVVHFKVNVRPEYRIDDKIYPVDEPIQLRVACVRGRQEGGLFVCSIPTLRFRFYFHDERALPDLVRHYLGEGLKELTPRYLSRYLPPKSVALDELVLHLRVAERSAPVDPHVPTLGQVAEPIGDRQVRRQFGRAWERDRELDDLVHRLDVERASVLLVGDPGVGKTTLLAEAVGRIERRREAADEDDHVAPARHRYWMTSGGRLVAGMKYLGEWQARCERVIDELDTIGGVLCIESLRELLDATGHDAGSGIAAFLLPYLQRGELRVVAEATPEELDACRRRLPGFADLFQVVHVPRFDRGRAITILSRLVASLERETDVASSGEVPETVYRLFSRFVPYQAFPGRTVGFLREVFDLAARGPERAVTGASVVAQFVRQTGLPELFLRDDVALEFDDVVDEFALSVIGQQEACRAAARVVTPFKAGLNDPGRPLAVLLFTGPTGVGKTELAKAVSLFFFGHGERGDRLVRLDMSEYAGPGSARRLVESAAGEPSEFVKRLRQEPLSVVLLDEIEKASPEVFDVLLSVFDEGRLTDQYGRVTTFRSSVIILTSNLGAERGLAPGFGGRAEPRYTSATMDFFRPEFYNRLDAVVAFSPLDGAMIEAIAAKELGEIAGREGLAKARLRFRWTGRLLAYVAREGFDPRYGARPLQRALQTLVVAPLAKFLLELPGLTDATILADVDESGAVTFSI
jgi:ATP-dependent Clp protease ATP-binding subunit ClpC